MKRILLLIGVLSLFAMNAFSQAGTGGINGAVRDATGAAVPGATVTVSNDTLGIKRVLESNGAGVFSAPALVPATGYTVSVEKTGFAKYEVRDITIQVGQVADFNVALSVASAATQVDVNASAPLIEDTKTDVSSVVNQRQILDLPVNGRRVDSFALLGTAVAPDGAFGLLSFRGIAGHNSFLTDGNDTTNSFYNENAGRTRIQSQISQEAVQEFQIISDNFAAEFGQAMGGVINTITKSGSNDLHGTGYWFFRNRTLNARDRYAAFNPQDIRHQSGFSLGGKLIKDKLFFFTNYEATRRNFPAIALITNANGNLFTATGAFNSAANPCTASAAQCTAAINMLTTRNFGTVSRTVVQDLGFAKLDFHINERNTLSASLSMLRWVSPHGIQATGIVFNTGNAIGNNADSTVRNAYGKLSLTSILNSRMVNEARFGWFKDRLYDPASPDFLYPGLGLAGLTVNSTNNLGIATSYPRLNPSERRFEYADNLSLTLGAHTMKFGVDFATTEDYVNQLINQFGSYSYTSLTNFALDFSGNTTGAKNWQSYSQTFGTPVVDTTVKTIGFYGQDQYRITPNMLFNIGVRYDYTSIPQPTISNPDYPQTGRINTTKDNIQPRAGLSYTVGKDRKTLLRGGYGIFYARYQTGLIENLFLSNGVYQKSISYVSTNAAQLAAGPVYPNNLSSTNFNPPAGSLNILFADKNLRNPYTHQANIGIERSFGKDWHASASYVWSRGVRLYGVRDLNVDAPTSPVTYTILSPAGTVAGTYTTPTYRLRADNTRPDPRYRQISQIDNPGLSYYDGMALQLDKRFSKGLQFGMAYTWAHSIDLNQSTATNNIFFSSTPTSFANDFAAERGSAANDVRHRWVTNFVYSPTLSHSNGRFARYFVNGWQLSSVTTVQSAQPINSTTSVSGTINAAFLVTNSLNGLGGGFGRVPFQPVSNLDVDSIYRVDARLSKKLAFTERITGYLTFEAFNLFNTPYDTARTGTEYTFNNCVASSTAANCPAGATGLTLTYRSSYNAPTSTALSPDGTSNRRAQISLRVTF